MAIRWLIPWLALAVTLPAAETKPPPLTTAAEVHQLTPTESGKSHPVRMRGVVTYIRGIGPELVIQDASGGVMVDYALWAERKDDHLELRKPADERINIGDEVAIEGYTVLNPPTPRVRAERLEIIGRPGMPAAKPSTVSDLIAAPLEGSFVEFSAILRAVRVESLASPPRLALEFGPGASRLTVWITRWDESTRAALHPGAIVRVRGILSRWKTENWLPYTTFIVVYDPSFLSIVREPVPVESQPLVSIAEMLDVRPDDAPEYPWKVQGVVTLCRQQGMVVQAEKSALWVRPVEDGSFQPGDLVEAVGYPGENGARRELEDAVVRLIGHQAPPAAIPIQSANFKNVRPQWMDGSYVAIRVRVLRASASRTDISVWTEFGNGTLVIDVPHSPDAPVPEPGSVIEVTGVLEAHLNRRIRQVGLGISDYELHLQGPGNLKIIRRPSWWTHQRLFMALGGIIAIAGACALWALTLRKRVREKSAALAREITARHDQELLLTERQRLARDIHDTIEQTLTGASLQLEAVNALSQKQKTEPPHPGEPLQLARRLLDRSRDELRRAVWDLTPTLVEQSGLTAALEAMAAELSCTGDVAIDVRCDDATDGIPDHLAAHLCRMVQEAISNAVRHGQAAHITVVVTVGDADLRLTIEDDGCGFNPATAPGIASGHFGVNGMKERMHRLGGFCEIHSRPGEGTTLQAGCPIQAGPPLPLLEPKHYP